jgi:DNA-binding NtrC family response regulator
VVKEERRATLLAVQAEYERLGVLQSSEELPRLAELILLERRQALLQGTRKMRILVVDDEQVISNTLQIILNSRGYEARAAYGCASAIRSILEWAPDYVISDMVMEDEMSGMDIYRFLRRACLPIEIQFFSGYAGSENFIRGMHDFGEDVSLLAKPVHPSDLLPMLERHFEEERNYVKPNTAQPKRKRRTIKSNV